ncbi:hypothetical protein WJX82_006819 [Trebouxia sp. C0006]
MSSRQGGAIGLRPSFEVVVTLLIVGQTAFAAADHTSAVPMQARWCSSNRQGTAQNTKAQSIVPIKEACTGRSPTRAVAARCSREELQMSTSTAAKTSAQMTARDAHPDANEYSADYHSSDDSDGPHKQMRQEGIDSLRHPEENTGHYDRKLVPRLIIGLNRRQQFQLSVNAGKQRNKESRF